MRAEPRRLCAKDGAAFRALIEILSGVDLTALLVECLVFDQEAVAAHATGAEQRRDLDGLLYGFAAHAGFPGHTIKRLSDFGSGRRSGLPDRRQNSLIFTATLLAAHNSGETLRKRRHPRRTVADQVWQALGQSGIIFVVLIPTPNSSIHS